MTKHEEKSGASGALPRLVGLAPAVFALLLSARAPAQAGAFDVPSECGSETEFSTELERLAGADAARARPSLLRIARDPTAGIYRLTLEMLGRTRELEHADCRVLFRSAIVIAAASVKANAAPAPQASAVASEKPTHRAPSSAPTAPASERPPEARLRAELAAGAGVALGVVPRATPAFELRGGIGRAPWGVTLAARYFLPQHVDVEGRSADIGGFGLRAGAVLAPWPWVAASLGVDVDWLFGRGRGSITVPADDSAWTVAPSAELALIPLQNGHLALELAASGRVALVRPVFEVTGFGELYQVPSLGMAALARGVYRFR